MCVFPAELIVRVLCYSKPQDIIRWRTVSQWFHAITYDVSLWKAQYQSAPLALPPGPHLSQSILSLERTLVRSARLAQSWTTRPMRRISSVQIPCGDPRPPLKPISGRWLVVCQEGRTLVLYDTDSARKAQSQVLWKFEKPVRGFDVESMIDIEGRCLVYVLVGFVFGMNPAGSLLWKLLEFRLNAETGELYGTAAMGPHLSESILTRPSLGTGQSRFLFIPAHPETVVFDTEAKVFYELRPFHVALDKHSTELAHMEMRRLGGRIQVAFTRSHLIAFHYYFEEDMCHKFAALVQVFTLPAANATDETGKDFFRLTHEGLFPNKFLTTIKAMQPCVNPVTGSTTIRLLDPSVCHPEPAIACVDLVLPEASPDKVLPLAIKWHQIRLPRLQSPQSYRKPNIYLDTSYGGPTTRGFFRAMFPGQDWFHRESQPRGIMKFELDATLNQKPRIVHSVFRLPEWSLDDEPDIDVGPAEPYPRLDSSHGPAMFDGTRGKLCYFGYDRLHRLVVRVADIE